MAATARPAAAPRRRSDRVDGSTDRALRVQTLVADGQLSEARDAFGGLVAAHQRRASRIAFLYLRDAADADEAVQDAFIKAFTRLTETLDPAGLIRQLDQNFARFDEIAWRHLGGARRAAALRRQQRRVSWCQSPCPGRPRHGATCPA